MRSPHRRIVVAALIAIVAGVTTLLLQPSSPAKANAEQAVERLAKRTAEYLRPPV